MRTSLLAPPALTAWPRTAAAGQAVLALPARAAQAHWLVLAALERGLPPAARRSLRSSGTRSHAALAVRLGLQMQEILATVAERLAVQQRQLPCQGRPSPAHRRPQRCCGASS